jgi:hypothetical protein
MARKLARYTTIAGQTYAPGDSPSKEHADLIDNDKVWEAEDEGAGSTPYAGQSAADLKKLIDERNEGREADQKISKSGNVEALAAALEADDADNPA